MTGIDTNVLVRVLANDNAQQVERARMFFDRSRESGEVVYVSAIVLCETAWVLRASFGASRAEIITALETVLATDIFQIEHESAVRAAIEQYRRGPADFSDYLIGELHLATGCGTTVTFDRTLRSSRDFSLL